MKSNPFLRPFHTIAAIACAAFTIATSASLHADEEKPIDDRPVMGLQHEGPIKVVYQVTSDDMKDGVNKGLFYLKKAYGLYLKFGVDPARIDMKAVFHSDASSHVLTDEAWNNFHKTTGGNPNTAIIKELSDLGIAIELCNTRRISMKWQKSDIHPDVLLVSAAYHRITDLQLLGYAYVKF